MVALYFYLLMFKIHVIYFMPSSVVCNGFWTLTRLFYCSKRERNNNGLVQKNI